MFKFEIGFVGVFAPSGELEAVESTTEGAIGAAYNLSPGEGKTKFVNRVCAPVIVFMGSLEEFADAIREGAIEKHKIVQRTSKVGPQPFKQV